MRIFFFTNLILLFIIFDIDAYRVLNFRSLSISALHATQLKQVEEAWRKGFVDCQEEVCEVLSDKAPLDLIGTYYRNGYGKFSVGKETIYHPFDSDGLITGITFDNGSIFFRNRFVRTRGFLKERRSQQISYRGAFGTQISGGWLSNFLTVNIKNTANTNVLYWNDRLYALWEGGLPHNLDPASLTTIGESRWKGALGPKQPFSAHPKIDPKTGNLISFSTLMGLSDTSFAIYEIDRESNFIKSRKITVPGFAFAHDIGVTENYYLLFKYPMEIDLLTFILGLKGSAQCIKYREDLPTELYVIPRDPSKEVEKVLLDGHFSFHIANTHEINPNQLVIDVVRADKMLLTKDQAEASTEPIWQKIDFEKEVPVDKLTRYTLSKEKGDWSYNREVLCDEYADFPIINPKQVTQQHRYIFMNCGREVNRASPLQGLLKYDTSTKKYSRWIGEVDEFLSEPIFAPREGMEEDDAYILSISTKTSSLTNDFCIFDARNIEQGPLQRIPLPSYLSYGLHGTFIPHLTFDTEEAKRKFKVYSIFNKQNWDKGIDNGTALSMEKRNIQPVVVATWQFGIIGLKKAIPILQEGGSALDAVERGINAVELNNDDQYYVGVGGYPNINGVMELDAAIMDHELRYGAVMSLPEISRPISVARTVMQECQHNILTGQGALSWALEHGFSRENILTANIEKEFYEWKLSQLNPSLLPPPPDSAQKKASQSDDQHDTIGMICLDKDGRLAAGTSTSGWRYKLAGRVGDSPVIGSGLYCDGDVAAAVATGDGEEIMRTCVSFLIVESIRNGMSVQEACVNGIRRIQALVPKKPTLDTMHTKLVVGVIAMDKHGNVGAASTVSEDNHQRGYPFFLVPSWKGSHHQDDIRILEAGLKGTSY